MTLYFKNALLLIERNSYGLNLLQSLMKDPLIEPRMYRETRERIAEKTQKDGFTIKKKSKNIIYGIDTTANTRKLMFDLLITIVNEEYDSIICPELYDDINHLEKKKNGKIEAAEGFHDDCLMAYLIFRYTVFYGKCFRDRFGIAPIPSKSNVKIISSQEDFKRIENIIMNANSAQGTSLLTNNPLYQELIAQNYKIKKKEEIESNNSSDANALNSF